LKYEKKPVAEQSLLSRIQPTCLTKHRREIEQELVWLGRHTTLPERGDTKRGEEEKRKKKGIKIQGLTLYKAWFPQ